MRYQARQLTTIPVNDWVAVDFSFETLVMVMTMVGWSPSRPRLPWHLYSMSTDAVMQPEQVMEALLGRQRVLRALLDELTEHQRTAAHIAHLTATLSSTSAALAALHTSLSSAEASLQAALDAARPRLAAAAAATAHPLPVADLIASGARLAPAIAAPPGWAPPQPLGGSVPPAVTDEAMRAGRLASLAGGVFAPPGEDGGVAGSGATEGAGAEEDGDGSSESDSDEEGSV